MLARAVHSVERLLVQQAHKTVARRDLFHDLHGELVVVGGDARAGEDGRKLVLRGGDLVMLGLGEHAELPQLLVQIGHKLRDARLDRAEIMVVHLLPLRRHRAEERASAEHQVLALIEHGAIHKEILLFGADERTYDLHVVHAEKLQHAQRLLAQRLHGAQKRRFLVKRLAAVGAERRRDAERFVLDKGIARRIPGGVAARLKRGAQSPGGEARSVRLAPDELLAGKLHDDAAVRRGGDKAVVLLRGAAGERLEPVGKMRRALFDRPLLHGVGHGVGDGGIQRAALIHRLFQRDIHVIRQFRFHHAVVKHKTSKIFRYGAHASHSSFGKIKKASRRSLSKTPLPSMGEIICALHGFVNSQFSIFLRFFR